MTREQITRLFGVSASLIVLALVGGAMLHKKWAPAIRANDVRPHGERGPCINCHKIIPPGRSSGLTAQPGLPGMLPSATPILREALVAGQLPGDRGRQPRGLGAAAGSGAWSQPTWSATGSLAQGGLLAPAIVAGTAAPHGWRGDCMHCHTIVSPQGLGSTAGAAAPRGTDPGAGTPPQGAAASPAAALASNASPASPAAQPPPGAWTPTPPLAAAQPPQAVRPPDPPEVEAMGMAVRASRGQTDGLMVVEVEGMARRSGLRLGDIIRAVDGQTTTNVASFLKASRTADPARGVVIDTVRAGESNVVILR